MLTDFYIPRLSNGMQIGINTCIFDHTKAANLSYHLYKSNCHVRWCTLRKKTISLRKK